VMALLGVVGLVILVITLRRPGWNNLPMGLTVLASAPLFWIGLMQMPLWVDVPADGAAFQWLLSGLMLLGGGFILVFGNRNRVASIKLGNVTASVEPLTIAQGGYVTVNVKFQPRKAVFVNGITAELLCHRSQRTGRTGSQDREHWIDYNATSMVKLDRMVQAGENIARSLEVVFPAGCHRSDSETQWELRLRIDAAKAIDWTEIYTIEVK
ncbi:MAG TPA: hypothetical protein VHS96_09385, partial [Bacteroidia bacterium]|nr:hypothetical protein [Bacteroidia bacterium]